MKFPHAVQEQLNKSNLHLLECLDCLDACREAYAAHVDFRLSSMQRPPRLLRVAQLTELDKMETESLIYLQVCHCGSSFALTVPNAITPSVVARFGKLEPRQLLHFLAEYRIHMKQCLITADSKLKSSFMDAKLSLPIEVVAAFTGEDLSEEQLLKLEKTVLATVLLAERDGPGGSQRVARKCEDDFL